MLTRFALLATRIMIFIEERGVQHVHHDKTDDLGLPRA